MKNKLTREFYDRDSLIVAEELLGKYLVKKDNNTELIGKIVEVEAYRGPEDKGAHSYNNRRTSRTEVMFGAPGYSYVYLIYGMYNCLNTVCEKEGIPQAVLIRAIEPLEAVNVMFKNRYGREAENPKESEIKNLTNGPGKLCKALNITKEHNKLDLLGEEIFITEGEIIKKEQIIRKPRIGIDYAEEYKDKPWRFYVENNKFVSKL
ncbi:DNA-3-methyladenine glycosylase [Clostridium cellulovorans]|uniref:Putative 3-methyladenine DNA glycosylase n=1 Tax=Clostridium cellulovorans (strain ATCC 35296 / DSM 3052 / OCM 3 / 743B) TaxID=573061 RepID=D9SVH7_CLOC7|nr:DNA-3-methyladenine glycosylase [Clostridium cellulovorans]ADL51101.1 DNA-3-methyladenine glycosylase [Clostridium cellulovorans 743B]